LSTGKQSLITCPVAMPLGDGKNSFMRNNLIHCYLQAPPLCHCTWASPAMTSALRSNRIFRVCRIRCSLDAIASRISYWCWALTAAVRWCPRAPNKANDSNNKNKQRKQMKSDSIIHTS
jgi:hypothetical protein